MRTRRKYASVVFLSTIIVAVSAAAAIRQPLWYDELFTFYIASLTDTFAVVRALLDGADFHPPLDYILRHLSLNAFGGSALAFRLPSIVAFLAASICLFVFVARRASLLPALVAFAFPLTTLAVTFSVEGRAYSLVLAFMCLSLVTWQAAAERPNGIRLALLTLSLSLGPQSHYYGILNYLPILVGEAMRSFEDRRLCWPIIFSILASLLPLALLLPFMANAASYHTHFWTNFGLTMPLNLYVRLFDRLGLPLMVCLIGIIALAFLRPALTQPRAAEPSIPKHEIAAAITLCAAPVIAYLLAEFYTKALHVKYVLITVPGAALLVAYTTHLIERWYRACAIVVTLTFIVVGLAELSNLVRKTSKPLRPLSATTQRFIEQADLPIAVANALMFLEYSHRLPERLRHKLHYLSDREAAQRFLGYDTNERGLERLAPYAGLKVSPYCEFTTQHQEFYLISGDSYWIVQKLISEEAILTLRSYGGRQYNHFHVRLQPEYRCSSVAKAAGHTTASVPLRFAVVRR